MRKTLFVLALGLCLFGIAFGAGFDGNNIVIEDGNGKTIIKNTPSGQATVTIPATTGTVMLNTSATFTSDVTLDDGSGASPSLILKDATDETGTFSKVDAGFLTLTTVAGDGFNILTGNLKVGNGTPGVTQDGEDAYIEGTLEVDGAVTLDAGMTVTGGTVNLNASSNNAVNIGTGTTTSTVTIGGAANQTIDIGSGNAVKTVTLGSTNTTSTTTINGGSGNVNISGPLTTDNSITATGLAGEVATFSRTLTDHTAEDAVAITVTAADTTSAVTTQFGLHITNAASTEGLDGAIVVTNADADDAVDDVIRIVDGGGGFNNYIYASQFKVSGLGVMTLANSETINNSTNGEIGIATDTANGDTLALKPATGGAATFKGTVTSEDLPKDVTWTMVPQTGTVGVTSARGSVQTTYSEVGTVDITGASVTTVTADALAGRTYEFIVVGTITGANGVKTFHLYIDDASVLNVATQGATAGDYELTCKVHIVSETSGAGNIDSMCKLVVAAGADIEFDLDQTAAKDLTDGGVIKIQAQLAHADDTVTAEYTEINIK